MMAAAHEISHEEGKEKALANKGGKPSGHHARSHHSKGHHAKPHVKKVQPKKSAAPHHKKMSTPAASHGGDKAEKAAVLKVAHEVAALPAGIPKTDAKKTIKDLAVDISRRERSGASKQVLHQLAADGKELIHAAHQAANSPHNAQAKRALIDTAREVTAEKKKEQALLEGKGRHKTPKPHAAFPSGHIPQHAKPHHKVAPKPHQHKPTPKQPHKAAPKPHKAAPKPKTHSPHHNHHHHAHAHPKKAHPAKKTSQNNSDAAEKKDVLQAAHNAAALKPGIVRTDAKKALMDVAHDVAAREHGNAHGRQAVAQLKK